MSQPKFKCKRCGKCCKVSWDITVEFQRDILPWIRKKRFDILKEVVLNPKYVLNPERFNNKPQWMLDTGNVLFGDLKYKCPFLEDEFGDLPARCRIHDARPQVCKKFPENEGEKVRSDVLDICIGSIFYHSQIAEQEGLDFIAYIDMIRKAVKDKESPPRKEELKEIAHIFQGRNLKVPLTSERGLKIMEGLLTEDLHSTIEKPLP
jgi:Fe-S-cluster containining protein